MAAMPTKRLFAVFWLLVLGAVFAQAVEPDSLQAIAPFSSVTRSESSLTIDCQDRSQVRLSILAPDLIRVRASFQKPLPERDHSWAIAKTAWIPPAWQMAETEESVIVSTDEVEAVVTKSPLIIAFRDKRTRQEINGDARPMMSDLRSGAVTASKKFGFDEHFYGLGEKAARLDKRRGKFTMWNSDTPGYTEGTDPIYQSIPFYIGLRDGAAYGTFFDNSYRTHFDFGHSTQQYATFSAEGGEMNYYFFYGPSIKKVLSRYAELTGHMPIPPLWALGNQQSRWSYYPASMVEEVVQRYRRDDLPLDVIHLDIDYMNGYRVFTWDTKRFPDPKSMIEKLGKQGVKVVTIVDPGVKYQPPEPGSSDPAAGLELASQEKSYYVFNQGLAKNYFARRASGELYIGRVWPGESVFVDYTLEDARRWWGDLFRAYTEQGVAGIWTDMNEPADFVDQTGKVQADVISDDEGERSNHAKNRNVFALLMARATFEGLQRLQPDKRPYVITRAGYAGIQRYSTMWIGDNNSTWDALALSIPMFQSLGLSGEAFVGADIGGFIGRADGELLTRWYQVGFLTPFCRSHKAIDGYDQEPWRFGQYYEDIIRKYLKLRYRLLPFLYTTVEEAHRTGLPVFRPLLLNYQNDPSAYNLDDQFMIGEDLLVAPVLRPGQTSRLVYLPEGGWIDYWTGKRYAGGTMVHADAPLETVPMYVRAGAIIPMGPAMNYVGEKTGSPLTFEIYPDDTGGASGTIYEDDGISLACEHGNFRRIAVHLTKSKTGFRLILDEPQGSFTPPPRSYHFLLKSSGRLKEVAVDGVRVRTNARASGISTWSMTPEGLVIQIPDDGRAHIIEIK